MLQIPRSDGGTASHHFPFRQLQIGSADTSSTREVIRMDELMRKTSIMHQPQNARGVDFCSPSSILDTFSTTALLEELREGCLAIDNAGVVRFINRAAACLLGVRKSEADGRAFHELLTLIDNEAREPVSEPLAYLIERANSASSRTCGLLKRRDGKVIPFVYSISQLAGGPRRTPMPALLMLRDASHIHAYIERLIEAVRLDDHTRVFRRGELNQRLTRVLNTMSNGECHALLFMDLDRFKAINDNAGHAAGDRVLLEVVKIFRDHVRERDTLARLGGDEFGLLLEHCPPAQARERAKTLRSAIADHVFLVAARRFALDVSIGIALVRRGYQSAEAVIATADRACYAAKQRRVLGSHIEELFVA